MINDILRRTTNTQAAVFTEKYDQANGTTSRKKKILDLRCRPQKLRPIC